LVESLEQELSSSPSLTVNVDTVAKEERMNRLENSGKLLTKKIEGSPVFGTRAFPMNLFVIDCVVYGRIKVI